MARNRKARTVEQNGELVKYRERENEVLFIDLRQWGEPFEKKYIQFTQEQIARIAENFHNWQREGYEQTYRDVPEYCYSATLDEIEAKGWSLVPSKYIRMMELRNELNDLLQAEAASRRELAQVFADLGFPLDVVQQKDTAHE